MAGYIILAILVGIQLLVILPRYFVKKNNKAAAEAQFEEYVRNMVAIDKIYMSHARSISKNLNMINYWLKTGIDPTDDEEDEKQAKTAENFRRSPVINGAEARKWSTAVNGARAEKQEDKAAKALRLPEFDVEGMEPCDVEQDHMHFFYSTAYGENLYYCVTPEALEKKYYKTVLYFTTLRPSQIPLVYPYKYEGAQMLSIYKHPGQALWLLKNWKLIREAFEADKEEDSEIDKDLKDFDL